MVEKDSKCPICGEPTFVYMGNARKDKLCKKHGMMLKKGEISLGKDGVYYDNDGKPLNGIDEETSKEILTLKKYDKCIICGKPSNGKPLCKDCYHDCKEMEDEIDRNKRPFELKDYYFNLRSANARVVNRETIILNIKKMYALANICMDSYDDSSLVSRINDDVIDIIEYTNKKKEIKQTSFTGHSDSQKSAIIRTLDGHIVQSEGERIIDDILYINGISHAYGKDVSEVAADLRDVQSDFFVPFASINEGVYIEYWGIDNKKDYLKNKTEKKKVYKENNIPLIEVEKDDVKDQTGLTTRIKREIKKYRDQWKKTI